MHLRMIYAILTYLLTYLCSFIQPLDWKPAIASIVQGSGIIIYTADLCRRVTTTLLVHIITL